MEYIKVDENNIKKEHICCALSGHDADNKKNWMKSQFQYGYTFLKANIRGKVFIEYIPAEYALSPIKADDYMFVYCLWVSGKYKGNGYGAELLKLAEEDAKNKGKRGMVFISSNKKKSFLADAQFLLKNGYTIVDHGYDDYILLCKSWAQHSEVSFQPNVKTKRTNEEGFQLYFSNQCVFANKYANMFADYAKELKIPFTLIEITDPQQAKELGIISTTFSLFYKGEFITNEIIAPSKFENIIKKYTV